MVHSPKEMLRMDTEKLITSFEEYDYGEYPTFTASGNGGIWSSVEDLKNYVVAMKKC